MNPGRTSALQSNASQPFARHLDPVRLIAHLWRNRHLIEQFTRREIEGRYRSSLLGFAWSFINPLVLLLVYTFVFGVIFKSRWQNQGPEHLGQYGLVLFAGMIAFGVFGECVGRAAGLIVATPNYVKKVVFPLELLAVGVVGSALFHTAVNLTVLLALDLLLGGSLHWTLLLIPVVLLPVVLLSLGLSWLLSSLGVFIRDLGYAVALGVQVLFFMTPIFYPVAAIPVPYRQLIRYNPLSTVVEGLRTVVFQGVAPDWTALLASGVVGLAALLVGNAWFMKTRRAFGDVI